MNAPSQEASRAWDARFFYEFQDELCGAYSGAVTGYHRRKAALIPAHCGRAGRVLELGAGGGQIAIATAELGLAVDAIELVPRLAAHARELAATVDALDVNIIEGDFYALELGRTYDVVTYWDGFGIGSDSDQRALLCRIGQWLVDDGRALIDIYTPWYWSRIAGYEMRFPRARRRYDFNAETQTMIDTWWPEAAKHRTASQHLKCYEPDELRRLLASAGLSLESIIPGGAYDPEKQVYREQTALEDAMSYTAVISD